MLCFVLFCLKGDIRRGTKLLSEELGDILVLLCPDPWTDLPTPGAVGTKHRCPPEWRGMHKGWGSCLLVDGHRLGGQECALMGYGAFSPFLMVIWSFGHYLPSSYAANTVLWNFSLPFQLWCVGKETLGGSYGAPAQKALQSQLGNHRAIAPWPLLPSIQHSGILCVAFG